MGWQWGSRRDTSWTPGMFFLFLFFIFILLSIYDTDRLYLGPTFKKRNIYATDDKNQAKRTCLTCSIQHRWPTATLKPLQRVWWLWKLSHTPMETVVTAATATVGVAGEIMDRVHHVSALGLTCFRPRNWPSAAIVGLGEDRFGENGPKRCTWLRLGC